LFIFGTFLAAAAWFVNELVMPEHSGGGSKKKILRWLASRHFRGRRLSRGDSVMERVPQSHQLWNGKWKKNEGNAPYRCTSY
jgi:hypothetical protein